MSVDETLAIIAVLRRRFPQIYAPKKEDICYATSNRQWAVKEMAEHIELLLVIGSRNSSNSNRLVEVARDIGIASYLIDDESDIDEAWLEGVEVVGVTSGASAPEKLVERVCDWFRARGVTDIAPYRMVDEDVTFKLPVELGASSHWPTRSREGRRCRGRRGGARGGRRMGGGRAAPSRHEDGNRDGRDGAHADGRRRRGSGGGRDDARGDRGRCGSARSRRVAKAHPDGRVHVQLRRRVPGRGDCVLEHLEKTSAARPFETLARIMRLPYSLRQGLYVWPFAYGTPKGELTEYERGLLGGLAASYAGEDYYGWRSGIRPDGTWVFFVSGD